MKTVFTSGVFCAITRSPFRSQLSRMVRVVTTHAFALCGNPRRPFKEVCMSKITIGLCTLVMLVFAPSVKADPIVITGGSLTVIGIFGSPNYTLTGQNFLVSGSGGDTGNTPSCFPCPSGTPVSISSFLVGSSLGHGTAIINGTTITNLFFFGQFSLAAPTVILPAGMTNVTVTAPFFFSGFITGCTGNSQVCETQIFTTELVGQGTATALFGSGVPFNDLTLYSFRSVTYPFEAAPVPEPMTILLLTSGLIGVGARLRSCRKNQISKN